MKRITKTFLAFTLIVCMLISGAAPAFAAENADETAGQPDWLAAFNQRLEQIAGYSVQPMAAEITANERQTLDFNTDWLFIRGNVTAASDPGYDDSRAEQISLPHARDTYDLFNPDYGAIKAVDWYRRHFTLSEENSGKRVLVEFNGGGQVNTVYVNGALVGEALGTFTHFRFDITDYITFGDYDNVIAVQVDSTWHESDLPPGDFTDIDLFGGLHGRAAMIIVDPAHIDTAFYYNDDVTTGTPSATVHGQVEVKNDYETAQSVSVESVIYNRDRSAVSTQTGSASITAGTTGTVRVTHTVTNPNLWSTDSPYLYTVETRVLIGGVEVDRYENTLGIRTLKVAGGEKRRYFTLNGEEIYLLGGNRHMQAPYLGNSLPVKLNERDAYVIKYDLGYNFVRTSHYENDPAFLEACDRIGLLVEEEPLGWEDPPAVAMDQFFASLKGMVKRDRNHPSIVMWSVLPNERSLNTPSKETADQWISEIKALDPSRLTIQEENKVKAYAAADLMGIHDYEEPGTPKNPNNAASWVVTEWNTNLGSYFVIPGDSEARKVKQVVNDGQKLAYLMSRPEIMGNLKWDIFGYMTSQQPNVNQRGKNVGYWRSSGVYGLWRDPLHKTWIAWLTAAQSKNRDIGDVLKICSEWKSDSGPVIYVATNLNYDSVTLYYVDSAGGRHEVANKALDPGTASLDHGLIQFTLTDEHVWAEGTRLVAEGARNGKAVTDTVWASTYESEKDGARLILHNALDPATYGNLEADGSDVAWILAELVDKNGQREFYGDENITVEIRGGPGELVYDGYSKTGPRMLDGLSGFYLRSEKDRIGVTTIRASADLGENYDDSDPMITYEGDWSVVSGKQDAYRGGYHQAKQSGAKATITFTGTQIVLYAESAYPGNGKATVTIDGGSSAQVDFTNLQKYDTIANQAVYRSPVLAYGEHTLVITANSANAINIDRIKVFDGKADVVSQNLTVTTAASSVRSVRVPCDPTLPPAESAEDATKAVLALYIQEAESIDRVGCTVETLAALDEALNFANSVMAMGDPSPSIIKKAIEQLSNAIAGVDRFLYIIPSDRILMKDQDDGVYYYAQNPGVWNKNDTGTYYANKQRTKGDYAEITFNGVKIELYSDMDTAYGYAQIYIDNIEQKKVDMYRNPAVKGEKYYTSGTLENGRHQLKIEVTAEYSSNPDKNACVGFGYAVVYKEYNEVQEKKVELAALLAKEDVREDRGSYTAASLDALDQAIRKAEAVLKDAGATLEHVTEAIEALSAAIDGLEPLTGAVGPITITCLDEHMADTRGELNKVYYFAKQSDTWVLTRGAPYNRYLKKPTLEMDDYCEIVFTGTKIVLYSNLASTNGLAWVQIDDEEKIPVDLYSNPDQGIQEVYTFENLSNGQHTVKIIAQNKDHNGTPGDGNVILTSINFAQAVIYTEIETDDAPDTEALTAVLERVNAQTAGTVHEQLWMSFQQAVTSAVWNSRDILTGTFPNIRVANPLPAGTTATRVAQVTAALEDAMAILGQQLTLQSVNTLAGITVPYGIAEEALPLPKTVKGVTSDGQSITLPIREWVCDGYDANTSGTYTFIGTLEDVAGLTIPVDMTARIQVTVREQTSKYTVTVISGDSLETTEYEVGAQVKVTAAVPAGQRFVSWTAMGILLSDEQQQSPQITFEMPASSVTLTAVYEDAPEAEPDPDVPTATYTLTVNGGSGGGTYSEGASVTATAGAPDTGMRFKEWSAVGVTLDDPSQNPVTFAMPANDVTLTAEYEEIPEVEPDPDSPTATYTLTVSGGSGGGTYSEGALVTVTAGAPDTGMRFKTWRATGVTLDDPSRSSVTFTMPANDVTLTARYEEIPEAEPDPPTPSEPSTPPFSPSPPPSTTTTVTVKNEDGSTTKTDTNNQTGTVTETTIHPNGDKTVVETRKNGTVTETVTRQDGYRSEMVTEPDGSFRCHSIDADGVITESRGTAHGEITGSVTLPQGIERAQVTVPAQELTPNTVAVIVHEDGTETVIKTSVLTDEGLKFLADGDMNIKLVDNGKAFTDVSAENWWWDAVQFTASRELFSGTGDNRFSPDGEMTRAMLVTVLTRLEGVETEGGDTWYSKALTWGVETGITDGTDPMSAVTREQMVMMLYRYAGQPETGGLLHHFHDSGDVSAWAYDAMCWAVEIGLVNGRGDNTLNPGGTATRAEVATILQRFVSGYFR